MFKGSDSVGSVAPGLPNITGSITGGYGGYMGNNTGAGALSAPQNSGNTVDLHGGGERRNNIYFDASLSNSIYGKSSTVQPNAFLLVPQIKF